MPKVTITRPLTPTRPDGTRFQLAAGTHDLSEEDANHWLVKAHARRDEADVVPHAFPAQSGEHDQIDGDASQKRDEAIEASRDLVVTDGETRDETTDAKSAKVERGRMRTNDA